MNQQLSRGNVDYITINDDRAGQRIDNFLLQFWRGIPRSLVYRLLRTGQVRINKKRCKPTQRLEAGDTVRIPPVNTQAKVQTKSSAGLLKKIEQAILYEDEHLMVVNKPAGFAVHGGSGVNIAMIDIVKQLRPKDKNIELIHRLDKETSGCLLIAKTRHVLRETHQLLREHKVKKHYLALVKGQWPRQIRRIDKPLARHTSGDRHVYVSRNGKEAVTHVEPLVCKHDASLVRIKLETGRTHQIRVHTAYLGHPLAGDSRYGCREFNRHMQDLGCKRLFLHAESIALQISAWQKPIQIRAPLPEKLAQFLLEESMLASI